MTNQKAAVTIADEDLDAVQGAGGAIRDTHDSYANLETNFVRQPSGGSQNQKRAGDKQLLAGSQPSGI